MWLLNFFGQYIKPDRKQYSTAHKILGEVLDKICQNYVPEHIWNPLGVSIHLSSPDWSIELKNQKELKEVLAEVLIDGLKDAYQKYQALENPEDKGAIRTKIADAYFGAFSKEEIEQGEEPGRIYAVALPKKFENKTQLAEILESVLLDIEAGLSRSRFAIN